MQSSIEEPQKPSIEAPRPRHTPEERGKASPLAAAAFLAGIVYVWGEGIFRWIFTRFPSVPEHYVLWQGRVGDIAAMWLTISVVAIAVFMSFAFGFWAKRRSVGKIATWTTVLIISAIIAPLLGELGTPWGV